MKEKNAPNMPSFILLLAWLFHIIERVIQRSDCTVFLCDGRCVRLGQRAINLCHNLTDRLNRFHCYKQSPFSHHNRVMMMVRKEAGLDNQS